MILDASQTPDSSKALVLAAIGLIYLYFTLSFRCLASGLPLTIGLGIHWLMESRYTIQQYPRLLVWIFFLINSTYFVFSTSYILYPLLSASMWISNLILALYRYETLRQKFRPVGLMLREKMAALEESFATYSWPILDFDGQGLLAVKRPSITMSRFNFHIEGLDLSYQLDAHTKIIAKVETINIRLFRDVTIGNLYVNVKGDGLAPIEAPAAKPVSRASTISSVTSNCATEDSVSEPSQHETTRKVPPVPIFSSPLSTGAKIPPPLPPRETTKKSDPSIPEMSQEERNANDEQTQLDMAIKESLEEHHERTEISRGLGISQESSLTPTKPESVPNHSTPRISQDLDINDFYPEDETADDQALNAALDEGAYEHTTRLDDPDRESKDMKASISATLEDTADNPGAGEKDRRIELHTIIETVPWWLKFVPGPLLTRMLIAPLVWLHPVKVSAIACTSTGKRIINLMELSGFKKAHPNPEIFRLIRKVFIWLQAGDISVILTDILVRINVPLASDHSVRIDLKAQEPTIYRNTSEEEEVLAKIDAISLCLQVPLFLLPNHESYLPTTPRHALPMNVNFSLPGVFNRELLTIGAAFIKASTMLDLQRTAQSRPAPTMHAQGQFSFRSFGQAVKQAAGDLAKQKGVQWGIRDNEIAKWVSKFAKMMQWIRMDVGGLVELPIDVYRLRMQYREQQSSSSASNTTNLDHKK